jgi:NADH:ubiquinone oxidoreductase subunit D
MDYLASMNNRNFCSRLLSTVLEYESDVPKRVEYIRVWFVN